MSRRVLAFAAFAAAVTLTAGGCAVSRESEPTPAPSHTVALPAAAAGPQPVPIAENAPKPPTTTPAERTFAGPSLATLIRDVAYAPDPDAAVDAYSAGLAINPDSAALHRAYLRRMVDLEVPQLAVSAADRLLADEPNNGLARAVLANQEASQGNFSDALTDISLAVPRAADEPFVQVTAAHLLAWYDNNPDAPLLPSYTRRSLSQAHTTLADKPAFADAFDDASNFYREARRRDEAVAATQPAGTQPATEATAEATAPAPIAGSADNGGGGVYVPYTPGYGPPEPTVGYYNDGPYTYGYIEPWWDWSPGFLVTGGFGGRRFDRERHDQRHRHERDDAYRDRYFGSAGGSPVAGRGRPIVGRSYYGSSHGVGGPVLDAHHLDALRNRINTFAQVGSAVRTGNRGSAMASGATVGGSGFRGLNPSDPHFRPMGSSFGTSGLGNIPGPLANIPGPLTNLPGPLSNTPPIGGSRSFAPPVAIPVNGGVPLAPTMGPGAFQQTPFNTFAPSSPDMFAPGGRGGTSFGGGGRGGNGGARR